MKRAKLFRAHEFYIFLLLILMIIVISAINPIFLSVGNIFSIMKSSIVLGILSLGVLVVLISGGLDVSFPVVAAFSLYVTSLIALSFPELSVFSVYLIGGIIGGGWGLLNGVLIAVYKFPAMVVTLGTSSLISGFMYTFVGTRINHELPESLIQWGKAQVFEQVIDGKHIGLPIAYGIYILLCIIIFLFLKYTVLGRSIFMLGGSEESADRMGINGKAVKIFIYCGVGFLAGIGGITQSGFLRIANPFELYGLELTVIAATVLGGAYIGGGKGTVIGTFLGVLVITIINSSLIILGVSSYWQQAVIGIVILLSVSVPFIVNKLLKN